MSNQRKMDGGKESASETICVLGLGYIGLPTASIFASRGFRVTGVDVVPEIVKTINSGDIHIDEPDLETLVRAGIQSGNLRAVESPVEADVFIIAVPTPFQRGEDGARPIPDLAAVESAARSIGAVVRTGNLVILESTVPVGTTEKMKKWVCDESGLAEVSLDFAHCPERILPGQMLQELVGNDRVIGGLTPEASRRAAELYASFCQGKIVETGAREAELSKLAENSFRDVNIAFANELSLLCDEFEIDVWELIRIANLHPRVNILRPGPGVGGHCIAVDPWFVVDGAPDKTALIQAARAVNESKPAAVALQIQQALSQCKDKNGSPPEKVVCLGLTFKPDVDDIRGSPAVEVVERLSRALPDGTAIVIVEPKIDKLTGSLAEKNNVIFGTLHDAFEEGFPVVALVAHAEFLRERKKWEGNLIVDACGIADL